MRFFETCAVNVKGNNDVGMETNTKPRFQKEGLKDVGQSWMVGGGGGVYAGQKRERVEKENFP
jgi:hypothetical protein